MHYIITTASQLPHNMKGTILTIGDEILIGQIIDTNSAWLSSEMTDLGIDVIYKMSISDKLEAIHSALDQALEVSDLVVMTGGLGPTKDDITKKAIAEYVGSDMYFDEALRDRIKGYFDTRGIPFLKAHEDQCYMPSLATSLFNKLGTAPGMLFHYKGKHILSMPGVPYEMKYIFSNSFSVELEKLREEKIHIYHRTIKTIGMGESRIAEKIQDIVNTLPDDISMSYLPSIGEVKLRLTAKSKLDKSTIVNSYVTQITDCIPELIYGYDDDTVVSSLQKICVEKGLTLSTAESCTGGYLAHMLTSISGSSAYYMGSIIAYDYAPKKALLNVQPDTLAQHGAVSEETVKEMLAGLLVKFKTDLGVAISGIAGPGGGLPGKPVGTIWMAYGSSQKMLTRKLTLSKDRMLNIKYTASAAMNGLRQFVDKGNN